MGVNLKQSFKMAVKSIWGKKMRSFLTMLGIIIGVAAVVIMVSVIQGQNAQTMKYFESQGTNKIDIQAYKYYGSDVSQDLYNYCKSMPDLVAGITPNIQVGNEMVIQYGSKRYSSQNWDNWEDMITVALGNDQYGLCNNYTLAGGRELSYLDIEKTNNVCILGGGLAEKLFDYLNPVGRYITVNGNPFLVVGVYEKKSVDGWPEMDNLLLLPYTFNRTLNGNSQITSYSAKATTAAAATEAITRLQAYLTGLIPSGTGDYYVQSSNQNINDMNQQLLMQSLVLGGIAGISLLVGGIGIMNIMLVTVTERTREIGIRKAIGAERKSIIIQFLIEAAVICGIGGIIGIIIGYLGSLIAGKLILNTILLPGKAITVGAFAFSVVLGIIFGMYPAVKASGLQPVEALRAE